ncbi:MAG: hypothetical protein GX612_00800 [Bacteroidales bacterium]|jgi:hypothetical protein|nr:hypothetical protein [Bacteroidales bacterium]
MNYYYKSEFELIESFLDAAGDPVDITNIDFDGFRAFNICLFSFKKI